MFSLEKLFSNISVIPSFCLCGGGEESISKKEERKENAILFFYLKKESKEFSFTQTDLKTQLMKTVSQFTDVISEMTFFDKILFLFIYIYIYILLLVQPEKSKHLKRNWSANELFCIFGFYHFIYLSFTLVSDFVFW